MPEALPTWNNPHWHGKWRIYLADWSPGAFADFSYVHDDYDGPPDNRCGYGASIAECIAEIDDLEEAQ